MTLRSVQAYTISPSNEKVKEREMRKERRGGDLTEEGGHSKK